MSNIKNKNFGKMFKYFFVRVKITFDECEGNRIASKAETINR